jgi:integrase
MKAAVFARVRALTENLPSKERTAIEGMLGRLGKEKETRPTEKANKAVKRSQYLLASELEKLIKACNTEKQRLLVKFLAATGCHVSEMVGIRLSACDESTNGRVSIRVDGKGNKDREILLPTALYRAIRECFDSQIWLFEPTGDKPLNRV